MNCAACMAEKAFETDVSKLENRYAFAWCLGFASAVDAGSEGAIEGVVRYLCPEHMDELANIIMRMLNARRMQ